MEAVGVIVILVVVSAFGFNIWWSVDAKRTSSAHSNKSPQQVGDLVDRAFSGLSWGRVQGPGDFNRKFRAPFLPGPIVSVDVVQDQSGTRVDVWMSGWSGGFGLANWGLMAFLKKRKVLGAVNGA